MARETVKCLSTKYLMRKRRFQRSICLSLACAIILTTTFFEMTVVIVEIFEGLLLYLNYAFAIFFVFNLIGNLIACSRVDTSISLLNKIPRKYTEKRDNWQFCCKCNIMVPPRSRHCDTCNTCILKKHYHCLFIGNCIGYYNYRYFITFGLYMAIGTVYATSMNIIYFWWIHPEIYCEYCRVLCFLFPFYIPMQWKWDDNGLSFDWYSLHIVFFLLNAVCSLVVIFILRVHIGNMLAGLTRYERKNGHQRLGLWRHNVEVAFGKHYYKAWISPLIHSELPHDGFYWSPKLEEVDIKKM